MADSWTWNVAELPYRYGAEIRGDKVVWIWDSGPGIPPTEEAQPLSALLQQGRAAIPVTWQQIPPPILDQLLARAAAVAGSGAGAAVGAAAGLAAGSAADLATGPTQFAPAVQPPTNPQGSGSAGWGPPGGQQGFGPASGPPASAPPGFGGPAPGGPAPGGPAVGGAGVAVMPGGAPVPTSASLPTAAPMSAPPSGDPKSQVIALIRAGEKGKAVDLYRAHFKVSAMLAREEVENIAQTLRVE